MSLLLIDLKAAVDHVFAVAVNLKKNPLRCTLKRLTRHLCSTR
jgi:hypothetical protein